MIRYCGRCTNGYIWGATAEDGSECCNGITICDGCDEEIPEEDYVEGDYHHCLECREDEE